MLGRVCAVAVALWLVSTLPAEAAEPAGTDAQKQAAPTLVIHVRALVDGTSQIEFSGNLVRWQHFRFRPPGSGDTTHGVGPFPTLVNGIEWYPQWDGNMSAPFRLPFQLPADLSTVQMRLDETEARGSLSMSHTPTVLSVLVDDGKFGGAAWYEFRIALTLVGGGAAGAAAAADTSPKAAEGEDATPPLNISSNFVNRQAYYEATMTAAQQLAQEGKRVEDASRTAADLQTRSQRLWQEGVAAQNRRAVCSADLEDKQKQLDYFRRQGTPDGDVIWFSNTRALNGYNKYQELVREAQAACDEAAKAVTNLSAEYDRTLGEFRKAEAQYARLKQDYDAKFATIFRKEFGRRRDALAAQARDHQESNAEERAAELKPDAVLGTYTWLENGIELGQVILAPKGACTAPPLGYGEAKGWEIMEDGLHLRFEGAEWLFLAGPPDCLLGVCTATEGQHKGSRAMLRLDKPPSPSRAEAAPAAEAPPAETTPAVARPPGA